MRRLIFLFLASTTLLAQDLRRSADWTPYPAAAGCIGGSLCRERQLRVPLQDRPVLAIRFYAHDAIGETADGKLRVKIDGNTVRDWLDIPRAGETFTLDVDELSGRNVVFEPASNDEVKISDVAVLYGRGVIRRVPRDRAPGNDWIPYPRASLCIGGDGCRKNGTRITIPLEDAPVLGVRFRAHDNIGTRADGRLSVRIDDTSVASYIDVQRAGKLHELDVPSVRGAKLVISTATDDEVEVSDVEVLYGRKSRDDDDSWSGRDEVRHEGGCIGGAECGGRSARIRIPIHGEAVESVRFYARDDVGTRAGGELRIRVDDETLRDYLDIPRDGKTFEIDGHHIAGDYLVIEPAEDDEVVVKDIRIRFMRR